MSISINSYSGLANRKGIGGLASGLDTDALIEKMTLGTRTKITNQMQKRQIAQWRQDDYRAISSQMTAFKSKYFTYSSGSTNLMSPNFFKVSTAKPSSPYVKVSGDAEAAKNMQISEIKQLAEKASFTSKHPVTKQKMETGAIYDKWQENTVAGTGISIQYGGKTQTLSVSSDFYLNSHDPRGSQVDLLIKDMNKNIEKNADLKGKLEFQLVGDKVSLVQIGDPTAQTNDLRIDSGNVNLMTTLGLYSSPKKTEGSAEDVKDPVFSKIEGTDKVRGDALFETNRLSGGILAFKINGKTQTLTLGEFHFSDAASEKSQDGTYTSGAETLQKSEIRTALETALSKATYDSGKVDTEGKAIKNPLGDILEIVDVSPAGNGTGFGFKAKLPPDGSVEPPLDSTTASIAIVGASTKELLNGMGFEVPETQPDPPLGQIDSTEFHMDKLMQNPDKNLGDVLSGGSSTKTTISMNLNNITKQISFSKEDKDKFDTPAELHTYLQDELDKAFGKDNVFVTLSSDHKLSFSTVQKNENGDVIKGNASSVFTIQNSNASGIMGKNGALHVEVGESNRMELTKTLEQMAGEFTTDLTGATTDGNYEITVNGVDFSFSKDMLLGDVLSKIKSDPKAGVDITYSSVTDTFSVISKETGAHTKVEVADKTGNLSKVLFGESGSDYTAKSGKDLELSMSFDGGSTFTEVKRSSNTISIDGVNLEITGKPVETPGGAPMPPITFEIERNIDELYKKLETFFNDYNDIVGAITKKTTEKRYGIEDPEDDSTKYLPLTDEQKKDMSEDDIKNWTEKAKMGLLRNDQAMYKVGLNMRRTMNDVNPDGDALFKIGISTAEYAWSDDGKLIIDEEKLRAVLVEDPERVAKLFTAPDVGLAARMQKNLEDTIGTTGDGGLLIQIAGRENGIAPDDSNMTREIGRMTDSLTSLKKYLIKEEDRYWRQFTQLEKYISQMNSQSEWLSSQSG